MNTNALKDLAKRSATLHAAYKLVRDARTLPVGKITGPAQLGAVFKVLPNTMLPLCRLFDAYEAVLSLNRRGVAGDLVECGVWNGGCAGLMGLANRAEPGPPRRLHLFDSFEGLPQPSQADMDVIDHFRTNQADALGVTEDAEELVAIGACVGLSQPSVEDFLVRRLGLSRESLVFHTGWFQDTVPQAAPNLGPIALLRLDGDWYESTKVCLEGLFDRVVSGGTVIIDDYGQFSGCRTAVDEFLAERKLSVNFVHSDASCVSFVAP